MRGFQPAPGDALVNLGDLFPSFDKLSSAFDPLDLLDLCAALETAVLTERMVAVGPTRAAGSEPLLGPLERAGIVTRVPLPIGGAGHAPGDLVAAAANIVGQPIARELTQIVPNFFLSADAELFSDVFAWATAMIPDVVYERELGIPLALSAHFLPLYYSIPTVAADIRRYRNARGLIWAVNRLVTEQVAGRRRAHHEGRSPFDARPGADVYQLPPIAVEVLTQAATIEGIAHVLLDVRERYRDLRRGLAEHDALTLDPSVSPAEKEVERARILAAINAWSARRQRHDARRLNRCGEQTIGAFLEALSITHSIADPSGLGMSLDLIKLARAAIKALGDQMPERLLSAWMQLQGGISLGAFDVSVYRYLETPSAEIGRAVERLFRHEFGEQDVAKVERYAAYVSSLRSRALGRGQAMT